MLLIKPPRAPFVRDAFGNAPVYRLASDFIFYGVYEAVTGTICLQIIGFVRSEIVETGKTGDGTFVCNVGRELFVRRVEGEIGVEDTVFDGESIVN